MNIVDDCFALKMWHTGYIHVLSHYDIFLNNWYIIQDVFTNHMQDSLYQLNGDVLELPCTISPLFIMGSVMFLIFLHLWYGGALIINLDVKILFVFEKVNHIMVEDTRLGHLECWSLWKMNEKLIPILNVISTYMVFLYRSK